MEELFHKLEEFSSKQNRRNNFQDTHLIVNNNGYPQIVASEGHTSKGDEGAAFEKIAAYLEEIILARGNDEIEVIEGIAHSIKILASSIDANELKDMAFKIELAARRGDLCGATDYIATIENMLQTYRKSKIIT
jgi:HPt (histidine-containing phosphotransfer) domain-containing protein